MTQKTEDANNGNESELSAVDKLAEMKRGLDAKAGGDSSEYVDKDKEDKEIEGAEEDEDLDEEDNEGDGSEDEDDSSDDDSEDDDDSNDGDKTGKDKSKSEVRFTQLKGDGTKESYIKNLEEAYLNSSSEALRLKDESENNDVYKNQVEAIKAAAKLDPEFGEKLVSLLGEVDSKSASGKPSDDSDPFAVDARTRWDTENIKEAKEFTDANPELITDPILNAKVKKLMTTFSEHIFKEEKRLVKAGEAMEMAYRTLGLEDKRKKTQDLVDGMKKSAAPTRSQASKKKSISSNSGAKKFSNLTLDIAAKMGYTKERLEKGTRK